MLAKRLLFFLLFVAGYCVRANAQQVIAGTVTDARDNSPLSGVSVTVKGTRTGTTTNAAGEYSISIPARSTLVFTIVGFAPQEIVPNGGRTDVQLQLAQSNLQEVIVTGYTTQNKRSVVGSVARLSADEIKLQPVGSFDKALQGKVPGLLSTSTTGQPGAAAEVTIRGKGSINGTNTPLYIVDGIQVNAADFATINPGDIETFTVLKDAASTSIYGSRGANGVIVLTTRKGRAGQTQVNYDVQYGYSELPKSDLPLMTSAQKLQYEFYDRPFGVNPFGWSQDEVDSLGRIPATIKDVLFHKGITQQHQVSASGGNEKTRFYLSGSLYDQQGVVITTGLKRYTGRVNIENTFSDFRIGLNASMGYSRVRGTLEGDTYVGSPLNAIRWFNPYLSLYDEEGNYQDDDLQGQPNPLRELLENNNSDDQMKGVGNAYIEYAAPWLKGLRLRTNWGADFTSDEQFNYYDRTTDQGSQSTGGDGQVDRRYAKTFRYTGTTSINYSKTMGDHEINASLFNEIIQAKSSGFNFSGFGLVGPFKNEAGITPGTATNGYIPVVSGTATKNGLLSYFVDATYGYKHRYYLSAGARRDGSSRLTKEQRWANFGQVGLSWIMSDENFLSSTRGWLNSLKLKSSYGSVGSQGIGDFTSRQLLSSTVYNGVGGLLLTNLQRPLTWERKLMFNVGLEYTLFGGRLGGTVEYYNNTTKDLFLDRQLSRTSGFASITNNLGRLQNQGIEVSLSANIVKTRDFTWDIEGNYSHNNNKLLDQNGQDENVSGITINKVGNAINTLYLVRYAGVDPATGDALYYKNDGKTTTNVYDPEDRVLLGVTDPPNYGGFSTTWNYKGVGLDVLFTYAFGNYVFNNDRVQVENPIYWYSNLSSALLREWQVPGDITDVPSAFSDFQEETSRFVEKGDFLRLRNVVLSYSFPKSILDRLKMKNLRLYAQGQNMFVFHNFQGYDPEVTGGLLAGGQYPQLKTVTFGLNIGF